MKKGNETMGKKDKNKISIKKVKKGGHKIDLSQGFCGCGSCQDALDTAFRNLEQAKAGDDCAAWHMLVNLLTVQLIANDIVCEKVEKMGANAAPLGIAISQTFMEKASAASIDIIRSAESIIHERLAAFNSVEKATAH